MAYTYNALSVLGYRGQPLANTFVRQDQEARQLAILFPGVAYTTDMPLLYYTRSVLLAQGADVLSLETNYHRRPEFPQLAPEERQTWLAADTEAAVAAALAQRKYAEIVLAGKSLGTLAMGHLVANDARLAKACCIWLTPLLREARLREQIKAGGQRGLFVAGTADPHYEPGAWEEVVTAVQGEYVLIPGADHSLEFPGNVQADLAVLPQLATVLQSFLSVKRATG